jgi:hypothetical protein
MVAASLVMAAGPARAYRTLQDHPEFREAPPVVWPFNPGFAVSSPPPRGVSSAAVMRELAGASESWRQSCSDFGLQLAGTSSSAPASGDGANGVAFLRAGWTELGLPADVAGTTDLLFRQAADGSWEIEEADILLNDRDFAWEVDPADGAAARRIRAVVAHEMGHALGLLHPCELGGSDDAPSCDMSFESALMYPVYLEPPLTAPELDDAAGFCALYGAVECGECLDSEVCVAGECIPDCRVHACATGERCTDSGCVFDPSAPVAAGAALGSPCAANEECRSSACFMDVCTQRCDATAPCPGGWACSETGLCTPTTLAYGEVCEFSSDCATGHCVGFPSDEAVCSVTCRTGADCLDGSRCLSSSDGSFCASRAPAGSTCSIASVHQRAPVVPWARVALVFWLRRKS